MQTAHPREPDSSMCHPVLLRIVLAVAMFNAPAAFGEVRSPALPTPAPVGTEPVQTTATYADWTLRCETSQQGDRVRKICEVIQFLQPQGQSTPIAQVAFGKLETSNDLHVVVALPVNIVFPSTVRIGLDEKDPKAVDLVWRRCLPGGCFAEASATDDALGRWRSATVPGRLTFKDAGSHDIVVMLPFRGLSQALDALAKQ